MIDRSLASVSLAFAACVLAAFTIPDARAGTDSLRRGFPVAPPPVESALSGGVVALRAPGPAAVLIPRGTFTMGSSRVEVQLALDACRREPLGHECDTEMFENELDPHRVTLSPFWIDRTEVTVEAYRRCAEAGVCTPVRYDQGAARFDRPDLPVVMVAWQDAQDYCAFAGKRLPTEAEWERAARGLSDRRFPWGHHYATRRANHGTWALDNTDASDGYAELAPVGSYPDGRTSEGVDDLAGNVAEWTADAYEDGYEAIPVTDPKGPSFGTYKVVRGGAYNFGMPWLRSAARMFRTASTRAPYLGFRCARSAHPPVTIP